MGFFKRLFKIGEAESNSLLDRLEDPTKMTEQGIRDMKVDLDKAIQSLAEIKGLAIRSKNQVDNLTKTAADYESKAMQLLSHATSGSISQEEADRLAGIALEKQGEVLVQLEAESKNLKKYEDSVVKLDKSVHELRNNISKWESEAKTLKASLQVSAATKSVNKQLASLDSSSTISMLEKMKDKVAKEEALEESYEEIANESKSVDDEIDKALKTSSTTVSDKLAALKAKMNQG